MVGEVWHILRDLGYELAYEGGPGDNDNSGLDQHLYTISWYHLIPEEERKKYD